MNAGELAAVVVGVVLVLVTLAWIVLHRRDPENAAGHDDRPVTGSTQFFGEVNDRPGDPGSESQAVPRPGEPGPSAEPQR